MRYDVDISYIMPPVLFADPAHAELLKSTGIELNSRGNYIAKFRDPQTAQALAGASDEIKAFFEASGFAFIPSGMNLPAGTFDSQFDNHLTDVMKRLETNLKTANLPKTDQGLEPWNGFEIGEFLVGIGSSKPIDVNQGANPLARPKPTKRLGRTIYSLIKFALFGALAWAVYTRT